MTYKFNNVYIESISTVAGIVEANGPLKNYFDKVYKDFYMGKDTFEQGEMKMVSDSIDILLNKTNLKESDIDLVISGNLSNQLIPSNYSLSNYAIPYIGIYSACSSLCLSIIIASLMLKKKIICNVSANNSSAEKQYRNPTEYGTPKPDTTTFTATGSSSVLISKKGSIKVESATVGEVVDYGIKDTNNVGAAMAPSASYVINKHLMDTKRDINYYDMVFTGDLGIYGKEILKDLLDIEYNIKIKKYEDCGCILYDLNKQDVKAGASGPTSMGLTLPYIIDQMKKKKYKRVLLVGTGALFSTTSVMQKLSIPCVSHAISLEAL